jgi:RNA polymerase sigma-70 factor (ECF subfamily)
MRARPLADPSPSASTAAHETAELVTAARAGDRTSFGLLYERYARFVHGVLLASAQRDDVQDLVQDVFFRALRQLHTLKEPAAFGSWIATLARNEARMHHRSTRPTEELTDQHAAPVPSPATLGTAEVLRALRALPERYREPLTLRLVEEMSGEEIARQTGLTHGTVRVYLHHGIRLLREQLGDVS